MWPLFVARRRASGSCVRKDVGVQLPPRPPFLSAGNRSRSCKHFARGRAFPIMTMPATDDRTTTESSPAITAAAFEDFYRAHHREVYAAMWLVTRDRHEAEEVTQDAVLRLLGRWEPSSVMEGAAGYLFRTAMNVWRSRRRRAAVALRRMMRSPEQTSDLEEAESRADVIRLLSSLSERQRSPWCSSI